jgi:hypothetical protein
MRVLGRQTADGELRTPGMYEFGVRHAFEGADDAIAFNAVNRDRQAHGVFAQMHDDERR